MHEMPFHIISVPGGFKVATVHSGHEHSRVPLSWENANSQLRAMTLKYGTGSSGGGRNEMNPLKASALKKTLWDWHKNDRYRGNRWKEPYHKDEKLLDRLTPKGWIMRPGEIHRRTVKHHLMAFMDNEKGSKKAKPYRDWAPDAFTEDLVDDLLTQKLEALNIQPLEFRKAALAKTDFITGPWLYENASSSKPYVQHQINKWFKSNKSRLAGFSREALERAGIRPIEETPEHVADMRKGMEDFKYDPDATEIDPDATDMEGEGRPSKRRRGGRDTRSFSANEVHFTPAALPSVPLRVLQVPPLLTTRMRDHMTPAEVRAYLLNRQRILVQNRTRYPYNDDNEPVMDIHPENLESARTGMGRKRLRC